MNSSYQSKLAIGVEKKYRELENRVMEDIIRRIEKARKITSTADWQLNRYRILGNSTKDIEDLIRKAVGGDYPETFELYDEVIEQEYTRARELYEQVNETFIPYEQNAELQQLTNALVQQSNDELFNITKSLGFKVSDGQGGLVFWPLAEYYNKYLDDAVLDIASGAFDYNTVIRRVVSQMTNSGLRTVEYASGHTNRCDVAARRAIMTGLSQLTSKVAEMNAQKLRTEYFEVDWHANARPSHRVWQGKVYSKQELVTVCGLGTGDGLLGWNCYHEYYPFIPGISERNYTDKWLAEQNRKEDMPKKFRGREYTGYEATQKQRKMETAMRAQRQKVRLLQQGKANADDIIIEKCKYQAQLDEYREFSKKMGLQMQRERIYYDLQGRVAPSKATYERWIEGKDKSKKSKAETIAKKSGSDIIKQAGEERIIEVHTVGKIDKRIYSCISKDIVTDEVIITDERISHIKERHPNNYEKYYGYLKAVVETPDYIIEANKIYSGLLLKEFTDKDGKRFKTVVRLTTSRDNPEYKNSIITFMEINEKEWGRLLRNKRILYKRK